jgi:hypothetical protein
MQGHLVPATCPGPRSYLQFVVGHSALEAALAMLPLSLVMIASARNAPASLVEWASADWPRWGPRSPRRDSS